jgi:class 3 adenylate cyclase/tetratricopeptide (TPR) repeat protein
MMRCAQCGFENREGVRFCEECGTKLDVTCPGCGATVPPGRKFCGGCGQALAGAPLPAPKFASPQAYTPTHLAEKILTSKSALEGERKQVTVLFADLKGSMELLADSDPEEARELLDPVLERMMEAVHRYEGTVNQVMGDGIMALFGAPLAHEDHAVRACYAGLRMQESVKRYSEEVRRAVGVPLHIRIGLNSGAVVVRSIGSDLHMDYTAVGQTTHLASRMEQAALPGSILISAETLRLVEGYVQVKPLGPISVKGLSEPVEVYEVLGAGIVRFRFQATAARGLTRFVGREAELDQLRQALERAGTGHGHVMALVGEPGVGKSRLFWEFTHTHRTQGWLILESGSVSYGKATPYLPVIDFLKAYFQVEARDDARKIREKVTGKLLTLDKALEPTLPAFLSLLDAPVEDSEWQGLEPAQRRQQTLEAVKRLLLRESQVEPLCLLVEDLHWIDSESQALLDSLVESLPATRLLLLVNYRPEYQHSWGGKSYYTQLSIDPLPPESAEELLQALLGEDPEFQPLKQLLIARTEGNPFFLEESVRTLVETGVLVGERGAYRLAKALPSIQVPATVQAVLAARIDRLPTEEKSLLQTAAVIGKDVPFALLRAIVELPEEELRKGLTHLQAAEFLYEASLFPELEYTFKHALTQNVAYESLLVSRRQALHAAAGRALEALYADRLEEAYDRLAYHYSKAEEAPKAVEYLIRSADKAARVYANADAAKALEEALVHVKRLPTEVQDRPLLTIVLGLAHSFYFLGRFRDTLDFLLRHQVHVEQLRDPAFAGPYYFWLSHTYTYLSEYELAAETAQRALEEATRSGDEPTMGKAYYVLARIGFGACRFPEGVEHGRQATSLLERTREWLWLGQSYWAVGVNYCFMGEFEAALEAQRQAHAVGEAHGDPRVQTYADWASGWAYASCGDWEAGIEACQRSLARSRDAVNTAAATGFLGYAYLEKGDAAQAARLLEQGAQQFRQFGYKAVLSWFDGWLSEALRASGQTEKARDVALESLEIARDINSLYASGWARRVLGRIAQAQGAISEAEAQLEEALDDFVRVHSRFEAGRTHLDLVELAHTQGKQEAATRHLAEAHSLFTALRLPKHIERTQQLARECGVPLPEEPHQS